MPKLHRIVAFGVFTVFITAAVGHVFSIGKAARDADALPALLPKVYANPAELQRIDTLHAGETLSELLARAELARGDAEALLSTLSEHQDPRRLLPGFSIAYRHSYLDGLVRRIEMKLDADHTLNVERSEEGWKGTVEEVPVAADTVVLTGVVETSLYDALLASDSEVPAAERPSIADILADRVFAWQVDFSRDLRHGDRFRILYERMVRPDGTARDGRVLGVQFTINKLDYEAYWFAADSETEDYFDREGRSLRQAFLRAPLQYRRISSAFSKSRFHPVLKKSRPHHGIDYAANAGTPIQAVGDGTVRRAGWGGGYGNVVEIRHKRGYSTRYAHLRGFAKGLAAGTRVKQGDVIGYVGSTGLSTAPHLHYEFHENGRPVDPNSIKFITGDPVPRRHRGAFEDLLAVRIAALDRESSPVLYADLGMDGHEDRYGD